MEESMTFLYIPDHGVPRRILGERRVDQDTAATIDALLRTPSPRDAAHALARCNIDMLTAVRVVASTQRRRE
jgi:hypothetical protein